MATANGEYPNQINLYSGNLLANSTKSTIPFLSIYKPIPTITLSFLVYPYFFLKSSPYFLFALKKLKSIPLDIAYIFLFSKPLYPSSNLLE